MRSLYAIRVCMPLAACLALLAPAVAQASWSETGVPIGGWTSGMPLPSTAYSLGDEGYLVIVRGPGGTAFERVTTAGAPLWQSICNLNSAAYDYQSPGLAPGLAGAFEYGATSGSSYRSHYRASDGIQDWGSTGSAGVAASNSGSSSSAAPDAAGGVYFAFNEYFFFSGQISSNGLFLSRWSDTGSGVPGWAGFPGRTVSSFGMNPAIAPDGVGGVYVMFQTNGESRVSRYDANGTRNASWAAAGTLLGPNALQYAPGYPFFNSPNALIAPKPVLVASGPDHVIGIWSYDGTYMLAQRFASDGTVDPSWPVGGVHLNIGPNYTNSNRPGIALADGLGGVHWLWYASGWKWTRLQSDGTFAPGFTAAGVSPIDGAGVLRDEYGAATAAPNGGLVFAWDDGRSGSNTIRLRWLLGDGTADPSEPDAGRVIPGPDADGKVIALLGDGAGGARAVWFHYVADYNVPIYMNFMAHAGEATAVGPGGTPQRLALARPAPNPAHDAIDVRCSLPGGAAAKLSLYDLAGRLQREVAVAGAGERTARLSALGSLPPGVYLLRLAQGAEQRSTRVVLTH